MQNENRALIWVSEDDDTPIVGFLPAPGEIVVEPTTRDTVETSNNGGHQGIKRRPRQTANMSSILKSLLGEGVVVELKNDSGKYCNYTLWISCITIQWCVFRGQGHPR